MNNSRFVSDNPIAAYKLLRTSGRASSGCTNADCPYSLDSTAQFFPHDTDCARYCMCDWYSVAYDMACPDGLHWNSAINICDWPDNVECKNTEPTTTSSAIESTTIITTTVPGTGINLTTTTSFSTTGNSITTINTSTTTEPSATVNPIPTMAANISTITDPAGVTTTATKPTSTSINDPSTAVKLTTVSSTSGLTVTTNGDQLISSTTEPSNNEECNSIRCMHVRLVWPLRPWTGKLQLH